MIELRTFGALDLRGSDGREFRAVLAQPKRLALLAYLAAAAPAAPSASTFHRRDTLLGLFWPDQDVTRARAALSRAVHYLRASLGDAVILSLGDEELGVDPALISCDATRFRSELSKGRLAEALELYRGDFMEGFFLSDLPELERWIEGERRRFRESAADAARTLSKSTELSRDFAMALHWARQASSFAPYDEPDARRVLLLLGRLGDRGSALEFFERFATRLRRDLELDPSPETVAALDAISTARQEPAAMSAPRIPPAATRGDAAANVSTPLNAAPTSAALAFGNGRSRWRLATLVALTVVILVALLVWTDFHKSAGAAEKPASIAAEKTPSIAVLPLANIGADTSAQYFSDGMTDELIATLSQVEGLRVAARTSSFVYKNRNAPLTEIARALNVDAVLEGSSLHEGNRVRITLQLVRAPEGYSIWSKTYEREVQDVFALQQDIGRDVAGALKVQLVPSKGAVSGRTTDPETYDLYLWGEYYWNTRTRDGLLKAKEFFQRAIARDSSYAPAYTGLADSYNILITYDIQPRPRDIMPKSKAAALRSLELDSTQSEAHAALAYVATEYEWDWKAADLHFRRALELNPNNATAHHWYSTYLLATGHVAQSLAEIDVARGLDPSSLFLRGADGVRHLMARDYATAVQQMEPALKAGAKIPALPWLGLAYVRLGRVQDAIAALEPASGRADVQPGVQGALAIAYAAAGRQADARALVHALETRAKREYYPRTWLARDYAALGDKDRALTWLETAYDDRDSWLIVANADPSFDSLRGEPRFRAILAKIRMQK